MLAIFYQVTQHDIPRDFIFINTALRTSNFTVIVFLLLDVRTWQWCRSDVASGRPYSSKNVRKAGGIECIKRPTNEFAVWM
jgi:hypothetical protein